MPCDIPTNLLPNCKYLCKVCKIYLMNKKIKNSNLYFLFLKRIKIPFVLNLAIY